MYHESANRPRACAHLFQRKIHNFEGVLACIALASSAASCMRVDVCVQTNAPYKSTHSRNCIGYPYSCHMFMGAYGART